MFHFKSIKTKLLVFFSILLIVVCAGMGISTYLEGAETMKIMADESLMEIAEASSRLIESRLAVQINAMEALATNEIFQSDSHSVEDQLAFLEKEVKRSGHLRMSIGDINGNVIFTDGSTGNMADRAAYQAALSGESVASDPVVSKLTGEIVLPFYVPIFGDSGQVIGVLGATRDGNELSHVIEDLGYGKSGEAVIIQGNGTVIAHKNNALVLEQYNTFEQYEKDKSLAPLVEITEKMLKGETGVAEYMYSGNEKYMAYLPIEGTDWFLQFTVLKSQIMENIYKVAQLTVITSVVFLVISMFVVLFIASSIVKPIQTTAHHLGIMATGDLTEDIPLKLLQAKDETGMLANAASQMQTSLKSIISNVMIESKNVGNTLLSINQEMEALDKSIEEIAATTEQLSAGSQQTAASTEEMNATSLEIERAIESIAEKAQDGSVTVSNVSNMANEMRESALNSRKNALEMYERTKVDLQKAIKQSVEVNKINELSESILEITAQTNLLSLNASIEAARAGEAGKGFAVVANEIRGLADSSKATVARIQEVTKIILEAVANLSVSSNEILDFVDQQVLKDYEYFVDTSQQSTENTESIHDMVTDFSAASEELLASIQNMVHAIEEISGAANESANGTGSIAQESTTIAHMSNQIIRLSEAAKAKSDVLIETVAQFKV